jgi:hypothetical protein
MLGSMKSLHESPMTPATTAHDDSTSAGAELARRLAKVTGPLARPLAGRRFVPLWAIVHHTGRVSGRAFATPVAIQRTADGFLIPMPFGRAQWPLNVVAAGGATIRWKGRAWTTTDPEFVGPEAWSEFGRVERAVMRRSGLARFLRVRVTETR